MKKSLPDMSIEQVTIERFDASVGQLAMLLHDCVHAGASIGFILPFGPADAAAFWTDKVLPELSGGGRSIWVATIDGQIAGTVQLNHDTPPNQPHRAEVLKLMVHPDYRRCGVGRALMLAVEARARRLGRSLLTLDTRTGDMAEPLYSSMGFVTAGVIPDYCRDPVGDRLDATTIMYRRLF